MKIKYYIVLLLMVLSLSVRANSGYFYSSDKLSSGLITCICQDQYGYIWIGTEYGLNRFDGYNFTRYLHERQDTTSITDNEVVTLYTDHEGTLWAGCSQGLVSFDYERSCFRRYTFPQGIHPRVNSLLEDKDGRMLAGTAGYGLYLIDRESHEATYLNDFNKRQSDAYYSRIFIDRRQGLWRSSHLNDLTRFSIKDGKPVRLEDFKSEAGQPMTFIDYSTETMLIACAHGILLYDYKSGQITDGGFNLNRLGGAFIKSAFLDSDGNLYIGTSGSGLMVIPRGEKTLQQMENTNRHIDLRLTEVGCVTEDRSGNLWIGCWNKGLLAINKEQEAFESWSFIQQSYRTGGSTQSIVRANDGGVWCTIKPGGIYHLDANGRITNMAKAPVGVQLLYRDRQGRYWLGTHDALYEGSPETGSWRKVYNLKGRGVNCMTDDGEGTLYFSDYGRGLCAYDTKTGHAEQLSMHDTDRKQGHLCNDWVKALLIDSKGVLWIATAGGISAMRLSTRAFNEMGWDVLLENRQGFAICETNSGDLLFSTDKGLHIYDRRANTIGQFAGAAVLQDKIFGSLVRDRQGTIWMSSTMGIWQVSADHQTIIAHINGNGLAGREYISGAMLHTDDDRIYFGTPDGITTFLPSAVSTQGVQLGQVMLTGIDVNGRSLSPRHEHFELSYRENTLELAFSLLDYRNAENISYEWRINGSNNWQQTGEGVNKLTLSELQPGTYNLEVRAANNGMVSDKTTLIHITIQRPWYKSRLAYLLYTLLALTFIGLILYNFERQRRRDLEETKMRFLINATHDIRSPLTLIMGPLEKLKERLTDEESQADIDTIDKNAQRLLQLVNQILDERKIDKGQMKLSCQETDLNNFVSDICKLYSYNAQQHHIHFILDHPEAAQRVWIDRINFDKVVANLLSNAFKYTPDDGEITVKITRGTVTKRWSNGFVELEVVDSGLGFEDDHTERFFERFYQGRNSKDLHIDGTGIGLNLCRAITEMHGGTITAANRKDGQQGAILTVTLPLGKDHLKPEQIEDSRQTEEKNTVVSKQHASQNCRILIVDDDREIGRYISNELGRWYRFEYVENGREALKRLLAGGHHYDLVISDVMMPEMDGLTLLRNIKQNPNISHIPVILLTSKSEVYYRLEGLKKGADAYMPKPFNMEELHVTIDNLVSNVRRLKGKFTGAVDQENTIEKVEVKGNNDALMEKIMKVINTHLSDPDLNMELLTSEIGISRAQLHRKMKEITGISTSEFIRNLRLEQAARLIKEKKINITQVAYSVGFNNQAHFSTVFKKHFGMTPSEYADAPNQE